MTAFAVHFPQESKKKKLSYYWISIILGLLFLTTKMSLSGEGADSNHPQEGGIPEPKNNSMEFEIRFVDSALGEGLFATSRIEACITQFLIETIDNVIFSCSPYCSELFSNCDKNLCTNCYKNAASVECTLCHSVHYCSEACMGMNSYSLFIFSILVTSIQCFTIITACLFEWRFE